MKTIAIIFIITASIFTNAQESNPFELDSLNHDKYVKSFIKGLRINGIIELVYLSDFNFARNDTYVVWKENNQVKTKLICNKKLEKKIKQKRIKLSSKERQDLGLIFKNKFKDSNLQWTDCSSELAHFYYLKIEIQGEVQIIDSKCIPNLKKDKLISPLLDLMDK